MSDPTDDARRHAPATQRNREPILAVLRRVLPARGTRPGRVPGSVPGSVPSSVIRTVLEVAAGTGEHAIFFAAALPALSWTPSDADPDAVASIAAWRRAEGSSNLRAPIVLDVTSANWPVETVDAVFSANMIHISPWSACLGLLAGAGRHLAHDGVLVLYGPYRIGGAHTAPSNEAFDRDLKLRNPAWGVRDLEAVVEAAAREGLALEETVPMPANNQTVVLRRT